MNTSHIGFFLATAVAGLLLLVAAPAANAATERRVFYQNGGNACTGALPTYEGSLRKRPKAIANEGTTTAFISCSMVGNDENTAKPESLFAYFTNRGTATTNVSCTFVNGDEFFGSTSVVQTVNLPTNALTYMSFAPPSPATNFDRTILSLSCALPPGVELNLIGQSVEEDVGA